MLWYSPTVFPCTKERTVSILYLFWNKSTNLSSTKYLNTFTLNRSDQKKQTNKKKHPILSPSNINLSEDQIRTHLNSTAGSCWDRNDLTITIKYCSLEQKHKNIFTTRHFNSFKKAIYFSPLDYFKLYTNYE